MVGIQSDDAGVLQCLKPGTSDNLAKLKIIVQGISFDIYFVANIFCIYVTSASCSFSPINCFSSLWHLTNSS